MPSLQQQTCNEPFIQLHPGKVQRIRLELLIEPPPRKKYILKLLLCQIVKKINSFFFKCVYSIKFFRIFFVTQSNADLFAHLAANHLAKGLRFICTNCSFRLKGNFSWKMVEGHVRSQHSDLHVCGVCSYYDTERTELSTHPHVLLFDAIDLCLHFGIVCSGLQMFLDATPLSIGRKAKMPMDTYAHHLKRNIY